MIQRKSLETKNVRALQGAAQRLDIAGRTRLGKRSLVQAILQALEEQPQLTEEIAEILEISLLEEAAPAKEAPKPSKEVSPKAPVPSAPMAASQEKKPQAKAAQEALPKQDAKETTPKEITPKATTPAPHVPAQTKPATSNTAQEKVSQPTGTALSLEDGPWTPETLEAQNSRQLQKIARSLDIPGRTRMSKRSLIQSILDFFLARGSQPEETSSSQETEASASTASTPKAAKEEKVSSPQPTQVEAQTTSTDVSKDRTAASQETSSTEASTAKVSSDKPQRGRKASANKSHAPQATVSSHTMAQVEASAKEAPYQEEDFQDEDDYKAFERDYEARAAAELAAAEEVSLSEDADEREVAEQTTAEESDIALEESADDLEKLAETVEIKPLPRDAVLQPDLEEVQAKVEPPPPHPPRTTATPYIDRGPTLPERYENTRVRAMIRDPQSVYVYWNTPEPPNTPWKIEARDEVGDIVHTFQVPPQYQSGYVRAEVSKIHMIAAHIQPPARPWFPVAAIDLKTPPKHRFAPEVTQNKPQTAVAAPQPTHHEEWVRWDADNATAHPISAQETPIASSPSMQSPPQSAQDANETIYTIHPTSPTQVPAASVPSVPSSADLQRIPPWQTRTQHPSSPHTPYSQRPQAPSSGAFLPKYPAN
ncbi:MAG: hypothetical protein H6728_05815 [Myxococcales bacterium]|nr:hypothetical protein [Myxococcales bacterium]MCB9642574.1 hypothetical protein [Myxococcales bacterium]